MTRQETRIIAGEVTLDASLNIPQPPQGLIVFAHGSGSSRHSPRNRFVAQVLHEAGLGTLLLDLLTPAEEAVDRKTAELRFNIGLLARRLTAAVDWSKEQALTRDLAIGLFGASTGATAALIAAADRPALVKAVVSRGGRPDLAVDALPAVQAPTMLIVGGSDGTVLELNEQAMRRMTCAVKVQVIPGATHLFEEPGALENVADLAARWFRENLA